MVTKKLVNIGSDNGLLPEYTKPLPEAMLTWNHWHPSQNNIRENAEDIMAKIINQIFLGILHIYQGTMS